MNMKVDSYKHEVHLNLNVRGLSVSPTLAINETSRRLVHEGKEIFKFGLGQSPFPVPEQVVESLKANAGEKTISLSKGWSLYVRLYQNIISENLISILIGKIC